MTASQDPIFQIAHQIEHKSAAKQQTYRNLCEAFKLLQHQARSVVERLQTETSGKDKDIKLEVTQISEQEFHVQVAGDLIIFLMHTNIIVLDDQHGYNNSKYVKEDEQRRYLGQVVVYNFMADSLKYGRMKDPGYLLARLLINAENRFVIEGERQLNFMFDNVSTQALNDTDLNIFVQLVISQAIETDLVAPAFPTLKAITLHQKMEKTQALGGGYKIGFQMSYQLSDEPQG